MKTLISNYQFNATQKKVTFSDYIAIDLERILLITNVTDNIIVYNFADPSSGGTVNQNVLTLTYDTTSMSDTDKLLIYYDADSTPVSQADLEDQNYLIRKLLKAIEPISVVDTVQRQKINIDGGFGSSTSTPLVARIYDSSTNPIYQNQGSAFAATVFYAVPDIWKFVDQARLNYQQCIRANLSFS